MPWHDKTAQALMESNNPSQNWLPHEIYALIDATYLQHDYTHEEWQAFAANGMWQQYHVAAWCVQRPYLSLLKNLKPDPAILLATVVNFPEGISSLTDVHREIDEALEADCDEIDVVFPYSDFLAGKEASALHFIQEVRKRAGDITLKVILESGAFTHHESLYRASRMLLDLGVDFLKTSTGMIAEGADPVACYVFLNAIRDHGQSKGLKLSGGIKTFAQAVMYLNLIELMFDRSWVQPQHVRIGASQLLLNLKSLVPCPSRY